jgi:hypothetical protein
VGSGIYPHYDMARFVRLGITEGMPCIAVTMKYVHQLTKRSDYTNMCIATAWERQGFSRQRPCERLVTNPTTAFETSGLPFCG